MTVAGKSFISAPLFRRRLSAAMLAWVLAGFAPNAAFGQANATASPNQMVTERGAAAQLAWLKGINLDLHFIRDNNVNRSSSTTDAISDGSYQLNLSRSWAGDVYMKTRSVYTLGAGVQKWADVSGLDRLFASIDAKWQYRSSGAFDAPIWSALLGGVFENFNSNLRDGTRLSAGASVWLPLAQRTEFNAALSREARNARNAVFDGQNSVLRVGLDHTTISGNVFYFEGEWRRGDQSSSGPASLASLSTARSFVSDDAFVGRSFRAYRFDGRVAVSTLGLFMPLSNGDAVDVSWRSFKAATDELWITEPVRYRGNQISIQYQHNF